MFSKITEKILGLSKKYSFYKTNYERLNDENKNMKEQLNEIIESNERIVEALVSNQQIFVEKFNHNDELLEEIEEMSLRIEKSSAYTNIKLDTKFDNVERLLMKYSDELYDKPSQKENEE